MIFDSLEFFIYLPTVFILYWFIFNKNLSLQNIFFLTVSYIFYGWWDWRFLGLIFISSLVDYFIGLSLGKVNVNKKRKLLLYLSFIVNLGTLGFFKYYNFFIESFVDSFSSLGVELNFTTLNIILPVGISFYTFQTLSYTIDVYKQKLKPTSNILSFFAFVSFFPQLVAGPIERASNLLPQFYKTRKFNYFEARDGMQQILWGFFKKIVIADNCAIIANNIFENYQEYSGITLMIGAIYFAFQIYGDFSGYSDIAIGTAKLFGIKLMCNFKYPYFSRDIAEFWRRWHISLSTWFRDYLYIPLGGSRGSLKVKIRNIFAIFIVSGFWHGANWTFIIWGLVNAIYFLPSMIAGTNRNNIGIVAKNSNIPAMKEIFQILFTFLLTNLAWVIFRSKTVMDSINYFSIIFSKSFFSIPNFPDLRFFPFILILVIWEWFSRKHEHGLNIINNKHFIFRWGAYLFLIILIIKYFGRESPFIYFQF